MQKNKQNRAKRFVQTGEAGGCLAQAGSGAKRFVQGGILVLAILFIAVGIGRQEHWSVMQKAVRICLECIGIG